MATPVAPPPVSRVVSCPVCTKTTHGDTNCHNCGARLNISPVPVPGILIKPPPPPVERAPTSIPPPSVSHGDLQSEGSQSRAASSSIAYAPPPPTPGVFLSPSISVPPLSSQTTPVVAARASPPPPPPIVTPGILLRPPPPPPEIASDVGKVERRASISASAADYNLADGVSFHRKRRIYPAHTILMGAFCFLCLGVLLAFKYSRDPKTNGIIAFISFMAAAIFVCICNLRLSLPETTAIRTRTFDHVGFKTCKLCCFRHFSVAKFLLATALFVLISLLVGCGVMSLFVRHGDYIRNNRWYFLMECVFASVLPAIPLAMISWNRGGQSKQLMLEAGLITSKLGGLHVVLEFSGIYARLFDHNTRVSLVLEHHFADNETIILKHISEQIMEPIRDHHAVENFLVYPLLFAIGLTIASILLTLLRRATCRDSRKERSAEKIKNYGEIGIRMKSMLVLNVFLCLIVSIVLGFGLRYDTWAVADKWADWVIALLMCSVAVVVVMLVIVAATTRFGGFIRMAPWAFASELALVCLLTMSPLAYIAFNRGSDHDQIMFQVLVLTATICGIHVLLELSGTYAQTFHGRYRKDNVIPLVHEGAPRVDTEELLLLGRFSRFSHRVTPAHRVLIFLLLCLICGFAAAGSLPERSTKTLIIVGFVGLIFVVVVICLCDLRMGYVDPSRARERALTNIGFKDCRFLCVKHFSLQWLITTSLVVALGGFLVLTGGLAAYIRYGTYIQDQFWGFLVECLMMSILTAIPIALISWNRGGQSKELLVEVFLITGKFGGLHIMLELSGVYQATFEQKERYTLVGQNWISKNETDIYALVKAQILLDQDEVNRTNEKIFLVFLAAFFLLSALSVALAFLRRRCCRDPNKPRSQEKLHAYWALGVRMKAMLVLSIVLCGLVLPVLILGLRTDVEFEADCADLAAVWSELALAAILFALVLSVIVTSIGAVTTRYGGYILMSPWSFLAELGVVVLLSITPMGYLAYNRGQGHLEIGLEMGILALKFGGVHLLLELSGYYATALGGRYRNDLVQELPKFLKSHALEDPIALDPHLPVPDAELGETAIERI